MSSTSIALIAGAGHAGKAAALALFKSHKVMIVDHNQGRAEAVANEIKRAGGTARGYGVDLLDVEAVKQLRSEILNEYGSVDAVIHLIGGWYGTKTLEPQSVENWRKLQPRILETLAVLTSVFGEDLKSSANGRFVMVSSSAVSRPTTGNIAYASAKAAAETWTEGVAQYFQGTAAKSVIITVKALLTDEQMELNPEKNWAGYTHVNTLASAIGRALTEKPEGSRVVRLSLTQE